MLNTTFPDWPSFTQQEADAVSQVLLSNRVNYWTGEETRTFERDFAVFSDCEHAIALANGTLALDLALKAFGIGPGDEVVVTPRTFIASISTVVTAGATPVFADVDLDSQNITASSIEKVLTPATKAIIVVHLAGMPADMDPIMALAAKHDIKVIEDCAQAHGARYKGRSVGSIGHVGAWSFCQDKIMSTGGEGGMVTTNDADMWNMMWSYKDHGKSWDAIYNRSHPPGFRWLHDSFGTNWRMNELQGVIGKIQLTMMKEWHTRRLENANVIWNHCRELSWVRVPTIPPHIEHAAYKAYIFIEPGKLPAGWTRDRILQALIDEKIPAYTGSCSEVYLEKAFEGHNLRPAVRLPNAKELGNTSLMFLVHPTLERVHTQAVCDALTKVSMAIEQDS